MLSGYALPGSPHSVWSYAFAHSSEAGDNHVVRGTVHAEQLRICDAKFRPTTINDTARVLDEAAEGSMPNTSIGAARCNIVWVSAPVPQPTSSRRRPASCPSQSINLRATKRRPGHR